MSLHLRKEKKQQTHVAEIASPVLGALAPLTELDSNFEIFSTDNLLRADFVNFFWFAVNEEWERRGAVRRDKGDAHAGGVERSGEGN